MAIQVRGMAPLLQVYDMPTSIRFYRDTLGFAIVRTSPAMGENRFHWALAYGELRGRGIVVAAPKVVGYGFQRTAA